MSRFCFLLALFIALNLSAAQKPNIILVVCDNLGYGDVGCFGSKLHRTPHLDKMAEEGTKFTHFYVSSGVCTPSRASIMTGSYPRRVTMQNTPGDGWVLRPVSANGLNPKEETVAEVMKKRGYETAIIGKWHLGDQPVFLPTRQGFDEFFGIPYSDDMTPREGQPWPDLPLMRNEKVVEAPVDRDHLTRRYTEESIDYIKRKRDKPFFLYIPQAMPGSTRTPYASGPFKGRSKNGPWGDSVEELDWSMGEILKVLKEEGMAENTLVIWTSDNGAPRRNPPQGLNLPMGGWGYTTAEGGMRVPCIMWWPGKVKAGKVCDELTTTMDLLPTFAVLSGESFQPSQPIDGKDISDLVLGRAGAKSPHVAFYYYLADQLQAVRSGKWKLHLPLRVQWTARGERDVKRPMALYDVVTNPGESVDLAASHPDGVQQLMALAEAAREDIGDLGREGKGQRPHGRVENPVPQLLR